MAQNPEAIPGQAVPADWPILQPHPLPLLLEQWQYEVDAGDYFDQIQPNQVGYLVWSEFPIRVYIDKLENEIADSDADALIPDKDIRTWHKAVMAAVEDWGNYMPIQVVSRPEEAHIQIQRKIPPLQISNGSFRSRSALTQYKLYRQRQKTTATLTHRCKIQIRPGQTANYIRAAARHELGHALGLWGHSPFETDALYFSQVREPAPISVRDINTLKQVYQQPTRLGWTFR